MFFSFPLFHCLQLPNDIEELSGEDAKKLKNCDHLELLIWSMEQMSMGNQHVECIKTQLEEWFDADETVLLPDARRLYESLLLQGEVVHDNFGAEKW